MSSRTERARPGTTVARTRRASALTAAWLATVGLPLWPSPVAPQDAPSTPSAAELIARMDSLRPLVDEVEAAVAAQRARVADADRLRASEAARVDTLRIGPVRVITPADQSARTLEVFQKVWSESFAAIDHSPALEASWFVFQWSDDPVPIFVPGGAREIVVPASRSRDRVEARVGSTLSIAITQDLSARGTALGRWVSGNPFLQRASEQMAKNYEIVAIAPSRSTRACLEGALDECVAALALGPGPHTLEGWYAPEERQALVERLAVSARSRRGGAVPGYDRCMGGDISACDELLAGDPMRLAPLPGSVRASVLAVALEIGGDGAWSRALDDPELSPEGALRAISGVPTEELIATWRERILEHRAEPHARLASRSGLSLLWIFFFAGLALRSTRWRLG